MTREDIIDLADKAGFEICRGDGWPDERLIKKLMRFANLVAAAEREYEEQRLAELAEPTVPSDCADGHQPVGVVRTLMQVHADGTETWKEEPVWTAPPQRKPLTEEEILSLFRTSGSPVEFARAIEAKHGIV